MKSGLLAAILLWSLIFSRFAAADMVIENFSQAIVGQFPSNFKTYPLQRSKAKRVYTVQSEGGRRFLHAEAKGETQDIAVQVFRRFDWDIARWPKITWQWRAKELPVPPAGAGRHFDDNACGVYVVFGGFGGKAIKYIWSSDLPVGREIASIPGRFYVIVARSGAAGLGGWQTMTVNVAEDYQRLFKTPLNTNPNGIGLLTDGDGTHSPSVCDYTGFELLD